MLVPSHDRKTHIFFVLFTLTLLANLAFYRLPLHSLPNPSEAGGVVVGSLIDFVVIMPILFIMITRKKGFAFKRMMLFMMIGVVLARLIIPAAYFDPYAPLSHSVFAIEGIILLGELWLIFALLKHMPRIISDVKQDGDGPLFVFSDSAEKNVRKHPLIRVVCSEMVMFYYVFASWKKRPNHENNRFTLHRKTSLIPLQVMLIHAILFETIAIHWWLHDVSMILSIVLLVLNIYSVLFFIGDIQATRLNPIIVEDKQMRVSIGLGKRMLIPFESIQHIAWGKDAEGVNLKDKDMLEFIALNIEEGKPHCVMTFKSPLKATLFMGIKRGYSKVAIRVDKAARFRNYVAEKMNHI